MKLYFAAAAIALFAAAPANAASVVSVGRTAQHECSGAVSSQSRAQLSARSLDNAISACQVALKGDLSQQARAGTLVNRGILEIAAGRNDAALADLNAGLSRDSNLAVGYMNRGLVQLRTGRYVEARADFDRAIALNTNDLHVAYFNRGEAQEAAGNLVAAYHDYRKAQQLAPDFKPAALELARFQVTQRRVASLN